MKANRFMVIVVLIHAAFFYYAVNYGVIHTKDSAEYLAQAFNIRNHQSWYCGNMNEAIQPELFSQRPPLYGLFIMLLSLISDNVHLVLLVQSILSIFNIYLCCLIIRNSGANTHWLLLVPFLFFPTQFIFSNMIMAELLLQTAVMIAVFSLLAYLKTKDDNWSIFYILSITAAVLTKPVFIGFPVVSIAMMLIIEKKNVSKLLFLHALPLIAIALVTIINGKKTGYYEYSSIARKLSVNYHAYYSSAFNKGDEAALTDVERIERHCSDEADYRGKATCIQAGASRVISANIDAYIYLTAKGMAFFFIDHSRYDIESFAGMEHEEQKGILWHYNDKGFNGVTEYISTFNPLFIGYLIISILINMLLLAAYVHFIFNKRVDVRIRIILGIVVLYTMVMTGMTGTTRFRMPVFLLILAATMITADASFFKKQKSARVR